MALLKKNKALAKMVAGHGKRLAEFEALGSVDQLKQYLEAGTMVLLGNPAHAKVAPTLIGQPARIKINANIGTSPFLCNPKAELAKLKVAVDCGADAVMDLSIGGNLCQIREMILSDCHLPLGTVPIYGVAQKYIVKKQDPAKITATELLEEIERQAEEGVDFMTVHCGVTRRALTLSKEGGRLLGIVSRGGSITARWMEKNNKENPLLTHYEDLLAIARKHNVVLSLGDGLRPGAGADAGDPAQWEEVVVLAELARKARQSGVQAMIEGPGHVPLHLVQAQIQGIKQLCHGAPLYVLGPLTTDIAAGYDHLAGAIGGALAGYHGADFLCYLTPAEHLTLPDEADVRQGVMASRIAAHSAEVSLGRPWAVERNTAMSKARMELNWKRMEELALDPAMVRQRRKSFTDREECAMCGEFCAVKMLR